MAKPLTVLLMLMFAICHVSSVSPSLERLMARLNRHHSKINWFYGDSFKSLWLYPV